MDIVKELFGTEDLYKVLNISKEKVTDEKALRSAYMKAALKYHPDKAPENDREVFTKKFQIIQKIYELFKDDDLRKVYDQTGTWPEDDKIEFNVESFGRLDENAVLEFKKMYQGSEEERQDIKKYYEEGQGDMFHICDNVFFLNVIYDEERVNGIIESLIEKGEMQRLTKGVKSEKVRQKKINMAKKEAEEAEAMLKERNVGGGMEDLMKAIAKNSSARGGFLDQLEAKYAGTGPKGKGQKKTGKKTAGATGEDQPPEKKSKVTPSEGGRQTRSRSGKK